MAILRSSVLVVLAFSLLAAACSDDAPTGVVFGEGETPETLPDDFPIPDDARIDSTLIDYDRGVTEMLYVIPAELPAVVAYYETNLPSAGYTIESSDGTLADWTITFADGDLEGTLVLNVGGVEITQAVVRFTES